MLSPSFRDPIWLLVTLGIITLLGCSNRKVAIEAKKSAYPKPNLIPSAAELALFGADEFELLALDPRESAAGEFHGFTVLGEKVISDPEVKVRILKALKDCMPELDDGEQYSCFEPRHGIRVRSRDTTFDFVICFECSGVDVYLNDQNIAGFKISRIGDPQAVFDKEFLRPGGRVGGPPESGVQ